jgi:integrase
MEPDTMPSAEIKPAVPAKRNGFWYLDRRVPKRFRAVDPRELVRISTGIRIVDDPRAVAAKVAIAALDADLIRSWRQLPDTALAQRSYDKAVRDAADLGVTYVPAKHLIDLPVDDIVKRLELLIDRKLGQLTENRDHRTAVMGGLQPSELMVSQMVDEFQAIHAVIHESKSPNQQTKWRVARDSAVATFLTIIGGDRALTQLTRAIVLQLRTYWQDKALKGQITVESANKYIGRISSMCNDINSHRQLGLAEIFRKSLLPGGEQRQRVAFDPAFVQDHILADGVLDNLNEEARAVVHVLVETGLRLSEACNLDNRTIHLDAPIPYVSVRPFGRRMKTKNSARDIPLVGCALSTLKNYPNGFPRYKDKADSLSALVCKFFEAHDLLPAEGQSLYSLRHTFEDRLQAAEAPEKLVTYLMGHKWHRERYGNGPTLEQKAKWLRVIAFKEGLKRPKNLEGVKQRANRRGWEERPSAQSRATSESPAHERQPPNPVHQRTARA